MIRTVAETGSTNADLLALAQAGDVDEGVWLRAERQSAGRGRLGRAWLSPLGNLYASTVVLLRPDDPSAASLSLVAGVALVETAGQFAPGIMLKWPNDVLLDGAKLAGILLERAGQAVIVGFGVNLLHSPDVPGRRTASLAGAGMTIAPETFAESLAGAFAAWLERWRSEGLEVIIARWLTRAHPTGAPLRAALPDGSSLTGTFAGLDHSGALRLRLADGAERVIHAGDVFAI